VVRFALALLHNSQVVDNKNEFLWHFYNNFRLSQGQLKTYATTPFALTDLQFFVHCANFSVTVNSDKKR
jgi:hypothetical protein